MPDTLEIIIATRNRLHLLKNLLDSIPTGYPNLAINVLICSDGDRETHEWCLRAGYDSYYIRGHHGSVYCRNFLSQKTTGSVLYSTDDIIFQPGAIKVAFDSLKEHFPNINGIIGFNQTGNSRFSQSGIALVGQYFMNRFPERKMFCPDYFHFAAQEIRDVGEYYNSFFFEERAIVDHFCPHVNPKYGDKTYVDARKYKARDLNLRKSRAAKHLIWGKP